MQRRKFITSLAASGVAAGLRVDRLIAADKQESGHPTYKTIADAMKSPREKLAFLPAITVRTKSKHPDYMATVDVDPTSKTYSQVVGRLSMPTPGDELHHFGWNACSSCYGERPRTHLVIPGLASSNIYIVNSSDPKNLKLEKTISGRADCQEDKSFDAAYGPLPRRRRNHDFDARRRQGRSAWRILGDQ